MQSAGHEGCPVPTFLGQEEVVIQMRMSALFVVKTIIEFYSVSTWTGGRGEGLIQCLHLFFFGHEEVNFLLFCVDVLYGWLLSNKTAKLSIGYKPTNSHTINSLYG